MNRLILLLLMIIWALPEARGQDVEYAYDRAGNRIVRKIVNLPPPVEDGGPSGQSEFTTQSFDDVLGERKVVIYPNPTRGLLRLEFQEYDGAMNEVRLLLYDMQGKLLWQASKVGESNILDLSSYPSGMYILQIIEGRAKSEWKIIKE